MKYLPLESSPQTKFSREGARAHLRRAGISNMEGGNVEKARTCFWRKNTPAERAKMQNERRKRKRKTRAARNKEKGRNAPLALEGLEDERAKTLARNERLLYLARKYYAKWHTLHLRERVRKSFLVPKYYLIVKPLETVDSVLQFNILKDVRVIQFSLSPLSPKTGMDFISQV